MNAKKCDRCGSYYLPIKFSFRFYRREELSEQGVYVFEVGTEEPVFHDLCPACMQELNDFLRGKENEN